MVKAAVVMRYKVRAGRNILFDVRAIEEDSQ